jgi:uncharacterized protein (DUF1800 family)
MAGTRAAVGEAAIERAWRERYGHSIRRAAPPPRFAPPPPSTPPPRRSPEIDPPGSKLPDFRDMARAPAWVRAYQRLTFGITPASLQEFNALGGNDIARYDAMVDQQLAWEAIDDSAVDARLVAAGYTTLDKTLPQLWAEHVASTSGGDRMLPSQEVQRATLVRAVFSKRQLRERLATFWNDHFNVTVSDYDAGPLYPHYNRNVIRGHAMGNFRAMLEAMARSTSMMYYLDNRTNRRSGPNENFARELLELHTMGAEHYLGFVNPVLVPPAPEDPAYPVGYTDMDVYETAAAFTGWSVNTGSGGDGTFIYRANDHDSGPKYVLGMHILPAQADLKDGRDVLDRLASHPKVAKFICRKLIRHFVDDQPPQSLVDSAAAVFRQNWQNAQQIRITLSHILHSPLAREAWGGKRRRPAELVVAALRGVGSEWTPRPNDSRSNDLMSQLGYAGHVPHNWSAPNGYPDVADAWSGSNSFAMTWRLLGWLTEASEPDSGPRLMPIVEVSRAQVPQWTARALVDFWCRRILGYPPTQGRTRILVEFMAQNGNADSFVIADTNEWKGSDLKAHYNHDRLRNMVSMILMSPELFQR